MAISAEQLNVILSARDREFTRAMERAERRVQRFSNQSSRNLSQTSQAWAALGMQVKAFLPALSAGIVIAETRRVISELDQIGKKADSIGLTTDALQILRVNAEEAGVSVESLDNSMMQFSKRLGEARQGTGTARVALEELGLSADQLVSMPLDEALRTVADAMNEVELQTDRTAYATQLFGRQGVGMLNLLREGSEGMERMAQNARDLGIVIDEDLIRNAEAAENQLGLMSRVIDANLSKSLINLAPLLVASSEGIAKLTGYVATFLGTMKAAEAESATNILQKRIEETQRLLDLYDSGDPNGANLLLQFGGVDATRELLAKLREEYEALTQAASDTADNMVLPEVVIDSAADLSALEQMVELQREEARLAQLTAEERERARIAKEAEAAVTKAIADQDLNAQETEEVERLRQAYIDAATAASSILNPVKAAGGATREIADAAADAEENITQMIERMIDASPALKQLGFDAENLQSVMGTVQSSMENAFMGMLDGTATAGDAFRAMAADIIRELYRVLVVQRLVGSFTAGGGGIMGSLFGALGGRASGGPVQAGQPYTVGEHGRELFVPSTSGRVLSAAQTQNAMRGDGGVTIHQTFQFSANGDDSVKRIIAQEAPKIAALTQKQIVDQRRRGGAMKGAFG